MLAVCRKIYQRFTLLIIVVGLVVVLAFHSFYLDAFNNKELQEGSAMLLLLIANICITMLNALYLACIRGNERYVFEKMLAIISQILQPVVCLFVLYKLPYAIVVTIVQVSANLFVSIIRYTYAKKELNIKLAPYKKNDILEKQIIFFAGGLLLSNIADQIFWKTDQIILAKLFNTATVTIYAVGAQIYTNYMYVGTIVASVFFPKVSACYQRENGIEEISNLFIRVGRIAFFLCYLVLSGFLVFGKEFIYFWVGDGYTEAYYIALIVMIPFTIDIIQNLGLTILQVANKYSFRAKIYFVAAFLNIFSTIILAKYLQGVGAALSTGITMFITSGIIMNIYYYKNMNLDIIRFWQHIGTIFLKLIPVTIFSLLINMTNTQSRYITSFIMKIILYIVVHITAEYIFIMNKEEKQIINRIILNFTRR